MAAESAPGVAFDARGEKCAAHAPD